MWYCTVGRQESCLDWVSARVVAYTRNVGSLGLMPSGVVAAASRCDVATSVCIVAAGVRNSTHQNTQSVPSVKCQSRFCSFSALPPRPEETMDRPSSSVPPDSSRP
jgi:hypothetical protein